MSFEPDPINFEIRNRNIVYAEQFIAKLPNDIPRPYLNASDYCEEVNLEWVTAGKKEATVCFYEGSPEYGYCYRDESRNRFIPGKHLKSITDDELPEDLLTYLTEKL